MNPTSSFHLARLDAEMRAVLFQMTLISEGTATSWEPHTGRSKPASRPPREDLDRSVVHSLAEAWERRYERAIGVRSKARVVEEAKVALREWRHGRRDHSEPHPTFPNFRVPELSNHRDERILREYVGMSPMEVAASEHVNEAHILWLRRTSRRDPLTGEPWPDDESVALEKARRLRELRLPWRMTSECVGIPVRTLRRRLDDERAA